MPRLALIQFLDGGQVDPGYGQGVPIGGHVDNSLPWAPARPDNSLPGGGYISTLPVFPFDPTLEPDNSLPGDQPEAGNELPRPGKRYIVKWLCGSGLILVPDNSLPPTATPK